MAGGQVELVGLTKRFGAFTAVDGIDLDIPAGEFFSLLGPSGCGKTTTLRMVAGFEEPDGGEVRLDGHDMSRTPPAKRPVNTVFQSYALFPHLRISDNVAFGLRRQKVSRGEVRSRVSEALELVQLSQYANRKPNQLSGGQQQRVALARALVLKPSVLLLDEPLGALDAKLRRQLQVELKQLQEQVGITFLYVTHDQEEALTMSDRIAVMNSGRVEQAGRPRDMYEEPETAYVADFLGVSNLMQAKITEAPGSGAAVHLGDDFTLTAGAGDLTLRGEATVTIRPERVVLERAGTTGPNRVPGMVMRTVYLGASQQVHVQMASDQTLTALASHQGDEPVGELPPGTAVTCYLPASAVRVLRPSVVPHAVPSESAAATT
ncbi:MAG: ABC transporter ATP-binding protein [Actinomycetia bacterium]|nr:ABC transporter ATP-binding protein [Actinomycetes bacterium]